MKENLPEDDQEVFVRFPLPSSKDEIKDVAYYDGADWRWASNDQPLEKAFLNDLEWAKPVTIPDDWEQKCERELLYNGTSDYYKVYLLGVRAAIDWIKSNLLAPLKGEDIDTSNNKS